MQRPNSVTPTKIPSLGVIVRLVSFTGASPRGLCARCDWRDESRYGRARILALRYERSVKIPHPRTAAVPKARGLCKNAGIGSEPRPVAAITNTENVKSGEKQCRNSKW